MKPLILTRGVRAIMFNLLDPFLLLPSNLMLYFLYFSCGQLCFLFFFLDFSPHPTMINGLSLQLSSKLPFALPDRSAVEIQYAAVYTEGILPSIQCTCSIYWQFSQSINQTSWSVHSVYTATILPYTVSLLHFGQGWHPFPTNMSNGLSLWVF